MRRLARDHAEVGQGRARVPDEKVVDGVLAPVHPGRKGGPRRRRLRRMRGAKVVHAAALTRELLHVGQPSFVHESPYKTGIHAVEPEDDELLLEFLGGPRTAAAPRADTDNEQWREKAFHGVEGSEIITSGKRQTDACAGRRRGSPARGARDQ